MRGLAIASGLEVEPASALAPLTEVAKSGHGPAVGRTHLYMLGLIVLGGVLLRGYELSARSFWFDEAFSWRLIQFPFSEMIERVGRDNHPPLYFIVLKGWAAVFGTSALALRSLSVLLGSLTILGMYLFISEAYRKAAASDEDRKHARGVGLAAAALVALSVFQIRWAWDVRMYTLATAFAVFSSWAMFRALRARTNSLQQWSLYGVLVLLFAYTHYYALFSIAAQALFILGWLILDARGNIAALLRSKRFWGPALAMAILVVGALPWVPVFLEQRSQVQHGFWTRPVSTWDVADVCYQMLAAPENPTYSDRIPLVVSLLCAAVMVTLLWRAGAADWYLFAATLAPFFCSVLVSTMDTKVFCLRYFLVANLFFLGSLAALLGRVPWQIERRALYAWLFAMLLIIHIDFWNTLDISSKPGARAAAAFLDSKRQTSEPVVVCSPLLYFSVQFHADDRTNWRVYYKRREVVHYEGGAIMTAEELILPDELGALTSERVWAVDMTGWGERSVPVPATWTLLTEQWFPEVFNVQGEIIVRQYLTQAEAEPPAAKP
jgi:uncharacterized membrane protein